MTTFYTCPKCGKRLIGRRSNGVFTFLFGGGSEGPPIVNIEVFGHIKMRCIRRSCRKAHPDHWNIFNFLPDSFSIVRENPIDTNRKSLTNPADAKSIALSNLNR